MNGFSLPLWPIFAAIYFLFSILLMLLLLLLLLLLYLPAGPFTGHHNRSSASISPNPLHARLSHQPPFMSSLTTLTPFLPGSSTFSILCPIYYPPYQTLLNLASLTWSPNCSEILPCSLLTADSSTRHDRGSHSLA